MKPGQFSFLGDEFGNIFQYSDLFLPGIEKIVGVYYSVQEKQVRIISRKRDEGMLDDFDEILQKKENMVMIQKFRASALPYTWTKKDDIPFEIPDQQKIIAPNLFSEIENVILVIRFLNETDHLNDLLLIYFNQNLTNFGLSKSDKVLTAENKSIIGHLLYYQFKSVLEINRSNKVLLGKLNHVIKAVITENNSIRDQFNQLQSSYSENVTNMARQSLAEISKEMDKTYVLADDAIEKIRNYKGNLKHLTTILSNAVIFTENLLMPDEGSDITIHSYALDFESYQVLEMSDQQTRKIDSRQSRAMQLLDKLERAAMSLKSRNIPLIGARIGQAMEPPVTAPAITDALGKNRNMIRQVLARYPEKWEIIRNEFKPLLNQLRKNEDEITSVESA
jgi:hypothetical protein